MMGLREATTRGWHYGATSPLDPSMLQRRTLQLGFRLRRILHRQMFHLRQSERPRPGDGCLCRCTFGPCWGAGRTDEGGEEEV